MKKPELIQLVPQGASIDWKAIEELFSDFLPLSQTPQDAIYHAEGDVWTHTKMVCESLAGSAEYQGLEPGRKEITFMACLLHDISKPECTEIEPDGRISSKGHSRRGTIKARKMLWEAGVPFATRERICSLVEAHQVPFFFFKSPNPQFTLSKLSWELHVRDLYLVARSDMEGRHYIEKQKSLDDIELFREFAMEKGAWDKPVAFLSHDTRMKHLWTQGEFPLGQKYFREEGSKVFMLSGLPASGKSSFIEESLAMPKIGFDDTREAMGIGHGKQDGQVAQAVMAACRGYLRDKQEFAFNATNLSRSNRQKMLDLFYQYGASVHIIYMEEDKKTILARNQERQSLPDSKIMDMLKQWQLPLWTEAHEVSYLVAGQPQATVAIPVPALNYNQKKACQP